MNVIRKYEHSFVFALIEFFLTFFLCGSIDLELGVIYFDRLKTSEKKLHLNCLQEYEAMYEELCGQFGRCREYYI